VCLILYLFFGYDLKNNSVSLVETPYIISARNKLNQMISELPDNSEIKNYVLNNPVLNISFSNFTFNGNPKFICDLGEQTKVDGPNLYKDYAGVYMFIHKLTNEMYIGSASNLYFRFKSHQRYYDKYERGSVSDNKFYQYIKYNGGWSNLNWCVINYTTNHILEFVKLYPTLKLESYDILLFLTQYEVRIYEQALLNHYLPSLNSAINVVFGFINWKSNNSSSGRGVPIEVYDSSYKLYCNYPSKLACCLGLDISITTLNRYLNMSSLVESPKLEIEVYLVRPDKPITGKPVEFIDMTENIPNISNIDLYSLPKKGLIALEKNKNKVFGHYHNAAEAAKLLDNKTEYKYINRYINKERLVLAGGYLLYFVMHPDYFSDLAKRRRPLTPRNTKKIILIDTLMNNKKLFNTIKDLLLYLGYTNTSGTSVVKRYIETNKLYKGRYKLAFL